MFRAWLFIAACAALPAAPASAQDAQALLARHAALRAQLAANPFGRPLHVRSSVDARQQKGEVFAVIERPFATVRPALARKENWCDIIILPANVKHCEASGAGADGTLAIFVARNPDDPLHSAYEVRLRYDLAAAREDYLSVALSADDGPFGTSDYAIRLEAAPLEDGRSFLHMSYSYALGFGARLALDFYLATSGRDKVGFSVVDQRPDGRPVYIDGVRGVIERNTMRYYLAVEAYLASLDAPPAQRVESRLRGWHAAVERYPQLREIGRDQYLELKRADVSRGTRS